MPEATHDLVAEALRGIDLHHDLLSVSEAATVAGVTDAAVRQWKSRGHLRPAGADEFGRPLFHGIDVLRAEAKTRKGARRAPLRAVSMAYTQREIEYGQSGDSPVKWSLQPVPR